MAAVTEAIKAWSGSVGLDTETTGLDPARDRVRMLQLAVGEEVCLIDLFAFEDPTAALAPLFAVLAEKEVVGHNVIGFDLPFLARLGFAPNVPVFDTAIASRVVYAGENADHDLAAVVRRELHRELNKGEQKSDWSAPTLNASQLAYAAADVAVLVPLATVLRAKAAARKVEAVLELEMRCALPVSRMAARGVGFATEPWIALADAAAERKKSLVVEMNALAPNPECLPGMEGWNWDSNTLDVPQAFATVGVTLKDTKEETLAGIEHPLARALLDYREASKKANTYGRDWVNEHVTEGRVYATWNQCQAKTGRMSCKQPNLQQIPRDPLYRKCFVARAGHVLVKCDFSQIELRIAAKVTGDKRMLAAYRNCDDLHTLTAARFLGVSTSAVTKEARQMAKPVNFGAIYGLGPRSLRLKAKSEYGKDMTEKQAQGFLDAFFAEFAGVRTWHDRLKRHKATEVRTLGGRRVAVEPDQFYGGKANYIVQGTGGDGLKRALVLLRERRGECPNAEPVLAVHDEVVLEVPEGDAEQAKAWLERCMVEAMAPLIDPVPVEVESKVGRTWGG
ncbi:MAG: bifunctional 3'-5' exonuclease/DNA polymerase [Planctomycetes bacterium]|nr:bifunctional 3'-5' exonuclease/DNA polymerase [Planctomycetota bacterium]